MNQPLRFLFASSLLLATQTSTQAQTVSDFENVSLPGPDTTYLHTQMPNGNGIYSFQSGLATFYGEVFFDNYWGGFNCSNHTDNQSFDFTNDASAITGSGVDSSSQYLVSFISGDFLGPDPTATIPNGLKLSGDAAGQWVAGVYVTNTTYAYHYMMADSLYSNNQFYYHLLIRGYENGVPSTDSVVIALADFTGTNEVVLTEWTWVNLNVLGPVDSLSFDIRSNDTGQFGINTPAYFALDNLTTLDGNCPGIAQINVSDITENTASITWENELNQLTTTYEIALDQSATEAPTATTSSVSGSSYAATDLSPNTLYFVHLRAACDDGSFSSWDTLSFQTEMPSAIVEANQENLNVRIHPNPATDYIIIDAAEQVNASIYSLDGRLLSSHQSVKKIALSSLNPGVYYISISQENEERNRKFRFVKL